MLKFDFNLKAKHLVIGAVVVGAVGLYQANKPLEYEFSSVYDGNKHHVLVHTDSSNSRYNEKCADDLSSNLLKAKIVNYDIQVVNDGEYELIYYNGNKVK